MNKLLLIVFVLLSPSILCAQTAGVELEGIVLSSVDVYVGKLMMNWDLDRANVVTIVADTDCDITFDSYPSSWSSEQTIALLRPGYDAYATAKIPLVAGKTYVFEGDFETLVIDGPSDGSNSVYISLEY
jgi:hypothetical protein